jgi:hypothetical protein
MAIGRHFPAGLPLELGIEVGAALRRVRPGDVRGAAEAVFPGAESMCERVESAAREVAIPGPSGRDPKRRLQLDEAEIQRQLRLVELWLRRGSLGQGLRALREALVNRVLLAWGSKAGEWLERERRVRAERALDLLRPAAGGGTAAPQAVTGAEQELGALWDRVCGERNPLAHAGMQPANVAVDATQRRLGELLAEARRLAADPLAWPAQPPAPRTCPHCGAPIQRAGGGGRD